MPSSCFGGAVVKMLIPPLARGDVFIEKYFHEKMHFHVGVASWRKFLISHIQMPGITSKLGRKNFYVFHETTIVGLDL